MLPTLRSGDRLRVDPGAYRTRLPRPGELVVVVDPEEADRWLVKRVAAVRTEAGSPSGTTRIAVASDAEGPTRDSRVFGAIDLADVVGRVYARYAPPGRRTEL
jgi:signal peptidase I